MTLEKLLSLLQDIPENAILLSDSGWECDPTDMEGIFYNEKKNEITFTQGYWQDIPHHLGEKCLYCAGWENSDENKKNEIKQYLKKYDNCYLDKSRIVRSYLEDSEGLMKRSD